MSDHVNLKNNRNEEMGTSAETVTLKVNGDLVVTRNFCPAAYVPSNITIPNSPSYVIPVHTEDGVLMGYMPVYHG